MSHYPGSYCYYHLIPSLSQVTNDLTYYLYPQNLTCHFCLHILGVLRKEQKTVNNLLLVPGFTQLFLCGPGMVVDNEYLTSSFNCFLVGRLHNISNHSNYETVYLKNDSILWLRLLRLPGLFEKGELQIIKFHYYIKLYYFINCLVGLTSSFKGLTKKLS